VGQSQSSQTPRKLLLHLRVAALEQTIILVDGSSSCWQQFVVWGAGRDGKDFVKALSPSVRKRVYCMVDVDDRKIEHGFYVYNPPRNKIENKQSQNAEAVAFKIPILHFSLLARDDTIRTELYQAWKHGETSADDGVGSSSATPLPAFGKIDKTKAAAAQNATAVPPPNKRSKRASTESKKDPGRETVDLALLPKLPVIVCVAMYRTNGALESNVKMIGRTEGENLWHFS